MPNTSRSLSFEQEAGQIQVRAAERLWTLARPANLESLWQAIASEEDTPLEFLEDERLPYWVELWPASLALADWLLLNRERIGGRFCLDLGCGLGLTSLAAANLGARVLAMDYEADALHYARRNAVINAIPEGNRPLWSVMDWRFPAVRQASLDVIWGGDVMYERRFVTPVLDFFGHALARGGVIWLAEPNRNVYDEFLTALCVRGWKSRRVYTCLVDPLHVQEVKINVSLWELTL